MKKIVLLIAFTGLFAFAKAQYVGLSNTEVDLLKQTIKTDAAAKKIYGSFQDAADAAMGEAPNPIVKILSEGHLEGDPDKVASLKAVRDADKIYALALVYRVGGDKKYLGKAQEYLLAWAKTNQSTGDPIDETKLEALFTGYDMLRDQVEPDARKSIDKWLDSIADGELNSDHAKPGKGTAINNWNSHRIKIITLIAYTIHTKKYDKDIPKELMAQLGVDLFPDGTSHDYIERDAFHYHIYTLEPLLSAITTIYRATGKNYFNEESYTKSSIKRSVDFMIPYVTGQLTHAEFANSKSKFDRARAQNGEKGYQVKNFNPKTAVYVLSQACYFDKSYLPVVKQLSDGNTNDNWQLLLNKIKQPTGPK
ncbi:alginate lyase family protein [Mucilaginibacter sp. AW1-3]